MSGPPYIYPPSFLLFLSSPLLFFFPKSRIKRAAPLTPLTPSDSNPAALGARHSPRIITLRLLHFRIASTETKARDPLPRTCDGRTRANLFRRSVPCLLGCFRLCGAHAASSAPCELRIRAVIQRVRVIQVQKCVAEVVSQLAFRHMNVLPTDCRFAEHK